MKKSKKISKAKLPDTAKKLKQVEEPLRQSEEKYQTILENIEDGYYEVDINGDFTFFNDSMCRILGYPQEEMMGMNYREFTDKEKAKKVFQVFNKVYKTGESTKKFNWQIIRKDGTKRYIEVSVSLRKISSGQPIGFQGIAHDITERKLAEESLKSSEVFLSNIFDNSPFSQWISDERGTLIKQNQACRELFHVTDEEVVGKYNIFKDKIVETQGFMPCVRAVFERGEKTNFTITYNTAALRHLNPQQKVSLILDLTISPVKNGDGKVKNAILQHVDITERKQIEYELLASESNFRNSLDDSALGVRISTIEGETIYANRAILDIYGYDSIEELKNIPVKERYTPESYAEFQLRKEKRLRGEFGPSEYEISIVRKNGEIRHIHVFRKEIFWNGEKQSQVIYQDITDRSQAEEKLKEILESLRKAIKTTIQVLGTATEARDPYTAGHQKRVADLSCVIATEMGLSLDTIEGVRMASSIHDIGKLSVPAEILSKPTKLTEIEFSLIKVHVQNGYEMLKDVESSWPLAEIVYQHHERMNGSGYPRNLKGDEILMEARIMAVADVVEAMASHRPYRPSLGIESALEEIKKNKGIFYDDAVADACLRLFREKGYQLT